MGSLHNCSERQHGGELRPCTALAPPLWMDVPSAEAPAFAGMTVVVHSTPMR